MSKQSVKPSEDEIRAAIVESGSITEAAKHLGVSRQTLHRWLRDLAITVERRTHAA